ncbi:TRAM, LAG1 and CLN8 (TLC) lipid-sensing domain containing protein, partial [Thalictrum thalictroides]
MNTIMNDMVTTIVAKVGSSSLVDLYNLKQSCKSLYEVGQDDYIFKTVSMEKIPVNPWTSLSKEAAFFLQRCQETENPEALFRLGMIEYFSHGEVELGRVFLEKATYFGHIEASYVLGIVLVCTATATDSKTILKGVELLKSAIRFKKVSRKRTQSILKAMWLRHFIQLPQGSVCSDPNCSKNIRRMPDNKGWPTVLEDDYIDAEEVADCDAC